MSGIALSLDRLSGLARDRHDYTGARDYYQRSLAVWRRIGDRRQVAVVLHNLGHAAAAAGDYAAARAAFEESLAIRQSIGDKPGTAYSLHCAGLAARAQGDAETAAANFRRSVSLWQELGDRAGLAYFPRSMSGIAQVAPDAEAPPAATQAWQVHLDGYLWRLVGYGHCEPQLLVRRAARLCGAAEALCQAAGIPVQQNEKVDAPRRLIERVGLDGAAFAAAWEEGRQMSAEEAIAYALEDCYPANPRATVDDALGMEDMGVVAASP